MTAVTWSQIETECGDYRAGFVATFHKYEGQDTDEKDVRGRTIKVTITSFARHVGIPEPTFRAWVNDVKTTIQPEQRARMDASHARRATERLDPIEKAKLAAELLEDDEVAEQVVSDPKARSIVNRATDEHYRRQAAERSERTERKAAGDDTDRRVDSLLWVNRLGEAEERHSRDVGEALRNIGPLPDSERYWLTGAVDRSEAADRAARRYLELGKSEFDAELETLLDNGA